MSPALNGLTALQRFECDNTVEIHNGIMFDFYPGLPHVLNFAVGLDLEIILTGSVFHV